METSYVIKLQEEDKYFVIEKTKSGKSEKILRSESLARRAIADLNRHPIYFTLGGITTCSDGFLGTTGLSYKRVSKEETERITEELIESDKLKRGFDHSGLVDYQDLNRRQNIYK